MTPCAGPSLRPWAAASSPQILTLDVLLEIGCLLVAGSQRYLGSAILGGLLAHLPLSLAEMAALAIHDTPRPLDG